MKSFSPLIIILVIILLLAAVIGLSSVYQVEYNEVAVITRLGKYERTESSGLRFKIPFAEQKYIVPYKEKISEEFGFQTTRPDVRTQIRRSAKEISDAMMLTADLKVIQVEWIVQYEITDARAYLFNVHNPVSTIRGFSKVVMSKITGDFLFDEIFTVKKEEINLAAEEKLQSMFEDVNIGVSIDYVQIKSVTPPAPVQEAYNEVLQAQQDRDKIINEAKTEYQKRVVPIEGEANKIIAEARGYKEKRIKIAEGEVSYFNRLYDEYKNAPDITKQRIYLETMSKIFPKLKDVYIVDENQKNIIPFLQMGQNSRGGE